MNIVGIIKILNELKRKRKLKGYAIFGAVGATFYMEPVYTADIDVLVLADTDTDYINVWRELSKHAEKVLDFGFVISDTKVQILPSSISPLARDSLMTAKRVRVGTTTTRVVDREHLILLFLSANRQKDRFKASVLLEKPDIPYLNRLLKRFDTSGILRKRIKSVN